MNVFVSPPARRDLVSPPVGSGLAGLYRGFFAVFGDDAWKRLDRARLETRAALASALASEGATVVECGTFIGHDTALLAAAVGPSGRVHTFDACPVTITRREAELQAVRAAHPATVDASPTALYDGLHEYVTAAYSPDKPGHTVIHHDPVAASQAFGTGHQLARATATSLDHLFRIQNVALLWLDAQGSAPFIIAGARHLLAKDRPAVVFEYAHTQWFGVDPAWPLAAFGALDYSVFDFSGLPMTTEADFPNTRCWTMLAVPNERLLPPAAVHALVAFHRQLSQPYPGLRGAVGEQSARLVELVSLRTAARAAGELVGEKTLSRPVFDIFSRTSRSEAETVSIARFPRLGVIAGTAWKPFTPDGLYIEELGYTVKGHPDRVRHWPDFNGRWTIEAPAPLLEVTDDDRPVFILGGDGAWYHWILNWLPRMMVFDEFAEQLGGVELYRFLVSAGLGTAHIRGLEMLGVDVDSLIVPPFESTVFMDDAIVPSFFTGNLLSPNVASWHRRRFGRSTTRRDRRLYITRSDRDPAGPPRRRVVNELELAAVLTLFGFETVRLAELTFDGQIDLFSDAAIVIGPHGAGFANLVFAQPGAKAVVFENSWNHTFMVDMVRTIGHIADSMPCADSVDRAFEARFTRDGVVEPEIIRNRDMVVDLGALRSTLRALCEG